MLKSNERSLRRKVQEMYLALRLEKMLTKEEILWLYLNQISFGHGRFGIEEAARYYFGKSVSDLDAGEAAVLASLPKAPEKFGSALRDAKDPKRQTRAKERQRYVLSQMARYHSSPSKKPIAWPTRRSKWCASRRRLSAQLPSLSTRPSGRWSSASVRFACPIWVSMSAPLATSTCSAPRISALEQGLQRIDERQGYRGRLRHLAGGELKAHLDSLKRDFPNGPTVGKTVEGVVQNIVDGEGGAGWATIDLGASRGVLPLPATTNPPDRYNPRPCPPASASSRAIPCACASIAWAARAPCCRWRAGRRARSWSSIPSADTCWR